ncbi:DUF3854 domain-containing protein [Moorella sp. Hama-1]|uniref:DUF3854 domain-containing protein n=1 Tax=Moorella sp. Hama-1 TaxID=2138101 RepID=UPI000D65A4ED|nr:DUF3854 domain-containing protein [Moorella sp. Hama-1]BCV20412.1 topoisomerase [Moorella sp. Hama-1]
MQALRDTSEPFRRVSRREPCPICGRTDWCGINSRLAVCMRVESDYPVSNGGWLHKLAPGMVKEEDIAPAETNPAAPVAIKDRAYRAFLNSLHLLPEHKKDLLRRGLSEEKITGNGYKSVPALMERWRICRELKEQGYALSGIPGFYQARGRYGGFYWTFKALPGYFIPVRDSEGRIQALQIRLDKPDSYGKYRFFSTPNQTGGSSSGAPCHVARPEELKDRRVWVTEGPLKADIASRYLGSVFIGVPGASNWRPAVEAIQELGAREVVIAYDRDKILKDAVKRAERELKANLRRKGIRVFIASWNQEKGIDDALVSGCEITVKEERGA